MDGKKIFHANDKQKREEGAHTHIRQNGLYVKNCQKRQRKTLRIKGLVH